MGAPPPGEVRFCEDGQLDCREDEPALERRDLELGSQPVLVQQAADARRRSLTVGADDDAVPLLSQVGELTHQALAVADDGSPSPGWS